MVAPRIFSQPPKAALTAVRTGSCYEFYGLEHNSKGRSEYTLAKGTTELVAQSSFRAVTVETFAVEPAHRVHTLQEVLQHDPWQPFYTTVGVCVVPS